MTSNTQVPFTLDDTNPDSFSPLMNVLTSLPSLLQENKFLGTPLPLRKPDTTFRIYYGNPNGFNLRRSGGDWTEYLEEMKRFDADLICNSEVNVDWTKSSVKQKMYTTIRNLFDHSKLIVATSSIPTLTEYKPGGTSMLSVGHSTGRIVQHYNDSLGRWSSLTYMGKTDKRVTIITAYQTCHTSTTRIQSLTAHAQQLSLLKQQRRSITPRQAFISDLRTYLQQLRTEHHHLMLIGDFNEPLDLEVTGMTQICSDFGFVDLMYHLTGHDEFPTWERGTSRRVDYALCDESVAEAALFGCYEPFKYRTKGDHRNIALDFDLLKLFGSPTSTLATPAMREFSSKDRTSVRQYLNYKYTYLQDHNFGDRIDRLQRDFCPTLAEQLDQDFQRSSHFAARKCKKKPPMAFVKQLAALRKEKNILLRLLSQSRHNRDYTASLAHLTQEGYGFTIPATDTECTARCKQLSSEIRKLEQDAVTHRRNELLRTMSEAQAAGDSKKASYIKNIMAAEDKKQLFLKLRNIRGNNKAGLNKLEVPQDPTDVNYKQCREWITVETPTEIEARLRARNQAHFGQAHGTFPTVPPFSEWVDWGASTHTAELILEGQFLPQELSALQQDLLRHMQRRTELDTIPDDITNSDWTSKIKTWSEATSTSPSGFHLTHSKALVAAHDLDPTSEAGLHLEIIREQLITWQVQLLNIALKNAYSYQRWHKIVNVLILKEPQNYKIHRLRVIHLYEQDYNLILAIKWRALIMHSTQAHLLHPGQYGAVPGKDAILPTMLEEFQYETVRASKRPLIHLDYDATACYDRIIMAFASLAARGFGQHRNVTLINARTLQSAKYLLKTMLGVSDDYYSHSALFPIYGSGQGAGNSPGIWCCISSILFDTYEANANGALFTSPCGKQQCKIHMVGFVDDTSGSTNDFLRPRQAPLSHYAYLASRDAQRWNNVLRLSGGALEDTKCSYHFMSYQFTPPGLPVLLGGTPHPPIKINFNAATNPTPLKQLSAYAPHKTLGVWKTPAGRTSAVSAPIMQKCFQHAKLAARSPLSKSEAWTYYHAIFLPSVTYPFPSCVLTSSQCSSMQIAIKQALLPKFGYNRNTPNAVVYGSPDFGGIGLRTLYVEHGLSQLENLIKCLRSSGPPRQLAEIAISWAQLLAGTGTSIFEDTSTVLPHLSPMEWIPSLRSHLSELCLTLQLSHSFVPLKQRIGDYFLMDYILEQNRFTAVQLRCLNACRLYLGAIFLSDLSNPQGTHLCPWAIYGTAPLQATPRMLFPYQEKPNNSSWTLWVDALSPLLDPHSLQLRQPLGDWLATSHELTRIWPAYVDPSQSSVYLKFRDRYIVHSLSHNDVLPTSSRQTILLPTHAVPVWLDTTQSPWRAEYVPRTPFTPPAPPLAFNEFLKSLPEWESTLLLTVTLRRHPFAITEHWNAIKNNELDLWVACDGSVSRSVGTFGWICALSTEAVMATGQGPSPGYKVTSFRAEAHAMLAACCFIFRLSEFTHTSVPPLTIYSDSESCIKKLKVMRTWSEYHPSVTLHPDWDVLQAIVSMIPKFPCLQFVHVKGHQDRNRPSHQLPLQARLNIQADHLASTFSYPPGLSPYRALQFPGNPVLIHSLHGTVTSHLKPTIRSLHSVSVIQPYICYQNQWSSLQFGWVDWSSHRGAIRRWHQRKGFITKLIHDWLPLGKLLTKYKTHFSAKCPSCLCPLEDRVHFFTCTGRKWKQAFFQDLKLYFDRSRTRPVLADLLNTVLRQLLSGTPIQLPTYPSQYNQIILRQQSIGWHNLLLGRFVEDWSSCQQEHLSYHRLSSTGVMSGSLWVIGVIDVIWKHLYLNWEERNAALHGADLTSQEQARYCLATRETESLYAIRNQVLPSDRVAYATSFDEHLQTHPTSNHLRQWLNTWQPLLLDSYKRGVEAGAQSLQSIRNFFTPRS